MREGNRITVKRCPVCGKERPLDWFGPEMKETIRDSKTLAVKKRIRYRKYYACWEFRELKCVDAIEQAGSAVGDSQ